MDKYVGEIKNLRYVRRGNKLVLQMLVDYIDPVGYVDKNGEKVYWQGEEWTDVPEVKEDGKITR